MHSRPKAVLAGAVCVAAANLAAVLVAGVRPAEGGLAGRGGAYGGPDPKGAGTGQQLLV